MTIFNYEGWRFYLDKDKGEYWPLKADNTPKQSAGAKFQWYLKRFKRLSAAERARYVEK